MAMIPVAKPMLDEREVEAVRRVVLSGWVTQGPEVAAFENEFAAFVGADHACAVSNCTTALHLALKVVGVGPGDEVVTVSHSFIATANAVRYCGAVPVFVDIEENGFNIDPAGIEAAITPKTKAILCVHQLGMPCDLERIVAIGRRHSIPVVEDADCASGSEILWQGRWEKVGKPHGDVACFSFHPRKLLTTGDGGMLTTANADYDAKFRLWRQHGMSVTDAVRFHYRHMLVGAVLAFACWEASAEIVAWMSPVIAGLLLAAPLSWLTALPAGPWLRSLLSTPDCRCPPAIVESTNRARGEWAMAASAPDGLGHAPRAA